MNGVVYYLSIGHLGAMGRQVFTYNTFNVKKKLKAEKMGDTCFHWTEMIYI